MALKALNNLLANAPVEQRNGLYPFLVCEEIDADKFEEQA